MPAAGVGVLIVVGTEDGGMCVYRCVENRFERVWAVAVGEKHMGPVRRLRSEMTEGIAGVKGHLLASCGDDWTVRVWRWALGTSQ